MTRRLELLLAGVIGALLIWWWGWSWWAWPGAVLIAVVAMLLLSGLYGAIEGTKPLWFTRRYGRVQEQLAEFDRLIEHDRAAAERVLTKAAAIMRGLAGQRPAQGSATLLHTFAIQADLQLVVASRLLAVERLAEARAAIEEAVELVAQRGRFVGPADADSQSDLLLTMAQLGNYCSEAGLPGDALVLERAAADGYRALGYEIHLADALHNVGITLSMLGRPAEAREAYQGAVDLYRQHAADPRIRALMAISLSNLCTHQPPAQAVESAQEAVALFRESGLQDDLVRTLRNLGDYLTALGRTREAAAVQAEAEGLG